MKSTTCRVTGRLVPLVWEYTLAHCIWVAALEECRVRAAMSRVWKTHGAELRAARMRVPIGGRR